MFINLSNHPSSKWSEAQAEAAKQYGDIVDLPFPAVDPTADEDVIAALADECCQEVLRLVEGQNVTVHVMGEMTLTYAIVYRLTSMNILCVASTTQRVVANMPDGTKQSTFKFVKFRYYKP